MHFDPGRGTFYLVFLLLLFQRGVVFFPLDFNSSCKHGMSKHIQCLIIIRNEAVLSVFPSFSCLTPRPSFAACLCTIALFCSWEGEVFFFGVDSKLMLT